MQYTKTTFINDSAPYLNADELNKIGTAIESLASASSEPCIYNNNSSAAEYKIQVSRDSAPESNELPLSFLIKPTIANNAGATCTPSWGTTAYPIYDKSTNAAITAGVMRANQPLELFFDGTYFWVDGDAKYLQYGALANTPGYWHRGTTDPTGDVRLNYDGNMYVTRLYGNEVWGAVYNETGADVAEGYPVSGDAEPGDVVQINPDGTFSINAEENNTRVLGIVSDEYAALYGTNFGETPIAVVGRLHAKVIGQCIAGDYLAASSTPGCLCACDQSNAPRFSIVAQALESKQSDEIDKVYVRVLCGV